jgi:hypothetical protein
MAVSQRPGRQIGTQCREFGVGAGDVGVLDPLELLFHAQVALRERSLDHVDGALAVGG